MKILIVSQSDVHGGAARAAYRLHKAFLSQDLQCQMLVARKASGDYTVIGPNSNPGNTWADIRAYMALPFHKLHQSANENLHSFNILPSGLHKIINEMDVDIVNLHWINREMISISEISKIRHPIVWTLHDMWAFSGAEHYDDLDAPERYKNGYINTQASQGKFDLDRWVWRRKEKHWCQLNAHFVTPSQWLSGCVKESKLLQNFSVQTIPNCIDLKLFHPINKQWARQILGLEQNKRYVLFGALSSTSNRRKGFHILLPAIEKLTSQISGVELLIVGASQPSTPFNFGLPTHFLGHYSDELSMALVYSAADIFVSPSLQDNLPNTLMEAMACGTPCVAFDTGGMPDLISHHQNGALAKCFIANSLAEQMQWVLQNAEYNALCEKARNSIETKYSPGIVTNQYMDLFQQVMDH